MPQQQSSASTPPPPLAGLTVCCSGLGREERVRFPFLFTLIALIAGRINQHRLHARLGALGARVARGLTQQVTHLVATDPRTDKCRVMRSQCSDWLADWMD